jgi:hypothetical protein
LRRPELGFSAQDFFQLPFCAPKGAEAYYKGLGAFTITANKREERQFLSQNETIYLNGGSNQGLKIGDRFVIVKTVGRKLMHPTIPRRKLGDVLKQVGIVRITLAHPKGSEAVIERCLDAIEIGDHLLKFDEPANIPISLRTDLAEPIKVQANAGVVVYARDDRQHSSGGDLIIIDKGSSDGLKVGEVLLAVRARTFPVGADRQKKPPQESTCYYLGQAMVVRTEAKTATCRVLRTIEELQDGDSLTR